MTHLTEELIAMAARSADIIPSRAALFARLSLLDWMTCGIAGWNEPLALKLRQLSEMEGGTGHSTIIGGSTYQSVSIRLHWPSLNSKICLRRI